MLAPAIPALSGIPLGVLVGERGALRLHHGGTGEILARNQLNVLLLAQFLVAQYLVNIRIHHFHAKIGFQLVHAFLMAAALEFAFYKRIDNSLGSLHAGLRGAEAENVCVVVCAGHGRRLSIGHQRRAHAGNLVGGHAHANARFANEHSERVLAAGHTPAHGLGKIRVITGLIAGGPIILHGDSLRLEMFLEGFLELKSPVIRANGEGCFAVACFGHRLLFDKWN